MLPVKEGIQKGSLIVIFGTFHSTVFFPTLFLIKPNQSATPLLCSDRLEGITTLTLGTTGGISCSGLQLVPVRRDVAGAVTWPPVGSRLENLME